MVITFNNALFTLLIATIIFSFVFIYIDSLKKRNVKKLPFVSFLIPTYNDTKYVEKTIKHLHTSYDGKFEIIIINDKSKDNTLEVLKKLKKKYKFRIIDNKVNKGKAKSINDAFSSAKGDIIFILDSDTILNKTSVHDMIARLESNDKVGGVSCCYRVKNRVSFWSIMQDLEYALLAFINASYNTFSTVSFWGGCMAFKRKAFRDIGRLSPNFITEDMDAALKLKEHGWKAEQSHFPVETFVPEDFTTWYKTKIRWSAGGMQCFIKHFKIYLRNPLLILFVLSITLLCFNLFYQLLGDWSLIKTLYTSIADLRYLGSPLIQALIAVFASNSVVILGKLATAVIYPMFNLPYILYDDDYRRKPLRLLWVFPYFIVYYPIFAFFSAWGFIVAIKRYKALEKGERAW